ncbi:SusD/RagB family nutrient-binding outer membrane lipoprotein [Marinilongibacter aquaticus]|uniref:SusD/RagB family nutrient-binding outer membrane lipoprotein n=1 Tax=Marinilongibacter aquaticus TaxID=2975157 RepID=UPI0021BD6322|nr:SusD/RagB family nutrient-binding outer membrane lipoprotein [Marinilongibacter aquaticus]UBM59057.1 SusD/RagB family nutrient-binding outer membrane lipoprotein [Marinilongibacter aquaticus]
MKNRHNIVFAVFLTLFSCSKFDEDINRNPNLPSQASGTQLIANAELYLPGLSSSPKGEFMGQYLAETQYVGQSLYPNESTSFYGDYQGPLMNLQTVLTSESLSGAQGPIPNQIAVAKILKAYFFWNLTDRFGDIPYSEALMGSENFKPKYDAQADIYNSLFAELKEANSMMVNGDISDDIMFGGDMDKWKKFANSMRMIMALRLSEVDPTKGQSEFAAAMSDGVMSSNSDSFIFQHLENANNQSYWYGQVINQNREWWALTENLVNYLKGTNDPRLMVFGSPARSDGEYRGLKFGEEQNIGTEEFSLLSSNIVKQDLAVPLLTYAQVLFAEAEAAARGWTNGADAESLYNSAIENSWLQWTGGNEGLDTFLSNEEIAFDESKALEQIGNQRWVHLFMFGYEAWSEWRRTGFPNNFVQPNGVEVPTRLAYPDNENFNNEANFKEAVDRQFNGEDSVYGKVWWDK